MNNDTTTTDITDEQIELLSAEAGASGDLEQVALCTAALGGDDGARDECELIIRYAQREAQADGCHQ